MRLKNNGAHTPLDLKTCWAKKMAMGSWGSITMDTNTSFSTEAPILKEDMIDTTWNTLVESIMDVALGTLPRKRVGPQTQAYRTNVQTDRRRRSLGELLRTSDIWCVSSNFPLQDKEKRQMAAHEAICKIWAPGQIGQVRHSYNRTPRPYRLIALNGNNGETQSRMNGASSNA